MPSDYGDSWDQGQRCYFSFSPFGAVQDGVDDAGAPVYIYQTQPFFLYDLNRGGGSSSTKITNAIELDKSITLTCTWQTHDEGKPNKPDIKANKIEVNQVIKITGSSAKSSASFIGLVESINQPDKSTSKGVLIVKPIYIITNVFDKTSFIENWSVICNEAKTSNYEINKDYASVEAFGLTGTTVGSAEARINYNMTEYDSEFGKSVIDINSTTTISTPKESNTSNYSAHYDNQSDGIYTYKTFGEFFIDYNGDINYFPWEDITVECSMQILTNTFNYTHKPYQTEDVNPNNQYGYLNTTENGYITTSKSTNTYSNYNFFYTYKKEDLENYKKYQTEEQSENSNKFKSLLTKKDFSKSGQFTTTSSYLLRSEGSTYYSTSVVNEPAPILSHAEFLENIISIKINPSNFRK